MKNTVVNLEMVKNWYIGLLKEQSEVEPEYQRLRLKETRRLAKHQFRGFKRISVHATLGVLAMMAVALSKAKQGQFEEVRVCARKIG